jgi:LacI family transcriptional regulator
MTGMMDTENDDPPSATEGQAGQPRLTINDIARLAEVSKKTVSRVLNQSPFVKQETRDRVNAIMRETSYTPDPQARGLAFRRSFLIGMVYDNPNPQYVVNMQQGLLDGMRGSGFELVVHPCDRSSPTFLQDVRAFVERQKLFGVVLPPSVAEDERLPPIFNDLGCAYVRIASVPLDAPEHMIVSFDRLGGAAVGRHLADLGHRRVGFISGPATFRSSTERRGGLEDVLAERGLSLAADYVVEGAYTFKSGEEGGRALLALPERPTAIFAGNDEMAAGVLHAARKAGLRVPQDLTVVGFDDFQIASRVWPSLTTVHTPTREVGRLAALKVIGRGDDGPPSEEDLAKLVPHLVIRESSGPAPGG